MTNPTPPDPLTAYVRTHVRNMLRALRGAELLRPPAELGHLAPPQAAANLERLKGAFAGAVLASQKAPPHSPEAAYGRAMLLGGMVLAEGQRALKAPLAALTLLSIWGADLRREALGERSAEALGEQVDADPQTLRGLLAHTSGARERGAAAAADTVMRVAVWAATEPDLSQRELMLALIGGAALLEPPPSAQA